MACSRVKFTFLPSQDYRAPKIPWCCNYLIRVIRPKIKDVAATGENFTLKFFMIVRYLLPLF